MFLGLQLRSIEEPPSRMVSEQGGTTGLDHPNSRAPLSASNSHHQHPQQITSQPQQYPNHILQPQTNHNNRHNHTNQSHQQNQSSHLYHHHHHHHHQQTYDPELVRMESWMDENPEFVQDYFIRLVYRFSVILYIRGFATNRLYFRT